MLAATTVKEEGNLMRALFVFVVVCLIPIKSAFSQVVGYSRFAPSERAQLSKCFSDMLTVVTRHNLREQLLPLLEAGCAGEILSYRDALRPHWPKTAQQSEIDNLQVKWRNKQSFLII
jgi:hypothetical protein